jgi:tetratricopeptide (TPR) repeat protein
MPGLLVESRRRLSRTLCAFAYILAIVPAPGLAQTREDFGVALQKLTASLAGDGGGNRASVDRALDDLSQALSRWDARIASLESQSRADAARATPPDRARLQTTLGTIYFDRGRFAEALTEFTEATRQDATLHTAWLMRALTCEALGQPDAARHALTSGLAARPDEPILTYHLTRLTPPDDDPSVLRPATGVLLKTAGLLRGAREKASAPFVALPPIDDRAPARYRFLPAGYGARVLPLLAMRQFDAAHAALRELIARDPLRDDPALSSAAFATAALDIEHGQAASALARLAAAEDQWRGSSELHRLRAAAYRLASRPTEAIAELETAIRIAPRNERAAIALLNLLLEQRDVAKAERVAAQAQEALPASAAVPWIQTQIYSALGRDTDVIAALERSLDAGPLVGTGAMWSMLGVFRMRSFDERATDALRHDVRLNPNRPEAHLLLGESLRADGRTDEAFAEFAAAVLIQPDSVSAHLNIGQMLLDAGRYSDAIASLRWVVDTQPGLDMARHALANALLRSGRQEEAAKEFDAFERLQAEVGKATRDMRRLGVLHVEAGVLAESGRCAEAIDVRTRLIELEPKVANHHVELAACLIRLGQYEPATEALERAGALGAPPMVFQWLADIYAELGRRQDSEKAAREFKLRQQELLRTP